MSTTAAPPGSPGTSGNAAVDSTGQQTGTGNRPSTGPAPGTNAAGTAAPSGSPGANAQNTAPAGGIGRPTTTNEQDSDAKIDRENEKADKTMGKICKNC
ncbi:hypothetical protein IVA96_07045 [Bradyrhizobium sp. 159]|uniref:hypothetical protein n=1 Tax=Bradyrhizobium sp. 159 TaxID=2782632 RepID=UPI001FFA99EE|nr:hypothetical protein [Bradyrhizobium sp. 159]MCK1616417.1 hypothetical protein [Bradyrhizobium sp. 159]